MFRFYQYDISGSLFYLFNYFLFIWYYKKTKTETKLLSDIQLKNNMKTYS